MKPTTNIEKALIKILGACSRLRTQTLCDTSLDIAYESTSRGNVIDRKCELEDALQRYYVNLHKVERLRLAQRGATREPPQHFGTLMAHEPFKESQRLIIVRGNAGTPMTCTVVYGGSMTERESKSVCSMRSPASVSFSWWAGS